MDRIARSFSLETKWDAADFAPLPDEPDFPSSLFCAHIRKHNRILQAYLHSCVDALEGRGLTNRPLQWAIPTDVLLTFPCSNTTASSGVREALEVCVEELSGSLRWLSLSGHEEVNAAVVQSVMPKRRRPSPLDSPTLAPVRRSLVVLDLSGSSLRDAGVKALLQLLFPSSPLYNTCAEIAPIVPTSRTGDTPAALSDDRWRLLPALHTLILDAVGLTDDGAACLCAHIVIAAQQEKRSGCVPADRDAILPALSLRRNRMSLRGVVNAICASLGKPQQRDLSSAVRASVGVVDVSWNSTAPLSSSASESRGECGGWCTLGAALLTASAPLQNESVSCPTRRTALLLQGCDVQADHMEALWVDGVLASFAQRFREAGKAEVLRATSSTSTRHLPSSAPTLKCIPWTSITRIDVSYNTAMGTAGVLHLLETLAALETARLATTSQCYSHGLVPHPFCALEELHLRAMGCDDAVLPALVHLLQGKEQLVGSVVRKEERRMQLLRGRSGETRSESSRSTAAVLRAEVSAFASLQAQQTAEPATVSSAPHSTPHSTPLPLSQLRLLDLSFNRFTSSVLVAAVMAASMMRAAAAPTASEPLAAAERDALHDAGSASPSQKSEASRADGEFQFVLALEGCGIVDAALDTFPRVVADVVEACGKGQTSASSSSPSASCTCALFLGHNTLTHDAVLRLRRWAWAEDERRPSNTAAQMAHLLAYVEGNAVVHPAVNLSTTAGGGDTAGRGGVEGLAACSATDQDMASTSFRPSSFFSRKQQHRVDWNVLSPLPRFTASDKLGHRESLRTWSMPDLSTATQSPLSPPRVAAKHRRKRGAGPQAASPSAAAPRSPDFSTDPEAYIDEFIAEAEQVMSERAYVVSRTADTSAVADMLLEHADQTSREVN